MHGRCERMLDERGGGPTFHCHGTHSRLARRGELGPRTQGIGRAQARAPSARHDSLRAPSEAARSAWRCSPRCSPRKAPTCGRSRREKRRWRRSRPISAPAICRRASAWEGMRSSPRSPGATPGTSSGRSDRRSRATGPHCRTRCGRGGNRHLVPGVRPGKPDHAEFPPRGAHRSDRSGGYRRLVLRRPGTGCGRSTARGRCPAP